MYHKNTETQSAPNAATKTWGFWVTSLQSILCVVKLSLLFYINKAVRSNFSWPVGKGRGCSSRFKHMYTQLAPGSPRTGASSRESRLLPVATKQSWFCHLCQRCGQLTAAEGKAGCMGWLLLLREDGVASGRNISAHTQFCLSFLQWYLLCKEVGARGHPDAGKIISLCIAQKP